MGPSFPLFKTMKKRSFACLLGLLFAVTGAHAWVGGPFSNNSFTQDGSIAGTYQAVISGKNIVGVMIFGASDTQKLTDTGLTSTTSTGSSTNISQLFDLTSNEGRFAIFADGTVVTGMASASINMPERNITAVLEGSKNRGTKFVQKQTVTTTPNITTTTDADGNVTTTEGTPLVQTETRTFTLNDVFYLSGNFKAKINHTFPAQTFEGSGTLDIKDPTGVEVVAYNFEDGPQMLYGGVQQQSTYWRIQPEVEETSVGIRVYGVRTSFEPPYFSSAVNVEYPSVSEGSVGGTNGGGAGQ